MRFILALIVIMCTVYVSGEVSRLPGNAIVQLKNLCVSLLMLTGIYGGFVLGRESLKQFAPKAKKHMLFDIKKYMDLHPKD